MELNRCSVNAEKMLKQQLWKCGHFRRIEVLFNVLLTGEFYKLLSHFHFRKQLSGGFCKIGVLQNFAKFTGKHTCQSLFLKKGAGLRPETLLKKETLAQVFSCEFCGIFFLKNTSHGCFCIFKLFHGTFAAFLLAKEKWLTVSKDTEKKLLQDEEEKEVSVIENLVLFLTAVQFCKWFFIIDCPWGKFLLLATVQKTLLNIPWR